MSVTACLRRNCLAPALKAGFLALLLLLMPLPLLAGDADNISLAAWLHIDPQLSAGTFLGIITASFIYLLTTWFAIRDRSQIYLLLMLLCLVMHIAAGNGYFGIRSSLIVSFISESGLLMFYLTSILFTLIYLGFDAFRSRLRYTLYAGIAVLVLAEAIAAIDVGFISMLSPAIGLGVLLLLLIAGINALQRKVSGSIAHILAFAVVFFGTLSYLPINWKMLGLPNINSDVSTVAYALCAMMFAVVIAVQFTRRQELKERELALSNERFQMAALGSNEGLYDWDLKTGKGYFSERLRRMFGMNLYAMRNAARALMRTIHRDDRRRVRKALFSFLRNTREKTLTLDFRVTRPDGRVVWVSATGVAVRDPATGAALRLIGSVGDVTEKKRAEARLKASEKRFRSIAEAHPVPVLIATLEEGEIVYASHGTGAALGIPQEALVGMTLDRFFTEAGRRRELMQEVEKNGEATLHECVLKRADGQVFYAALSARLIHYELRPCAVIGINDISERKSAEVKIRDQEAALQQSEKLAALGGLLAGVAHELNNPLSVIVGQAMLMQESAKDEKTGQRAEKIHKAGERCSRIVRSFLALARRKAPERKPVNINEVVEGAIELLAFQLRTDNVELIRKLQPDLPEVLADGDQMTQVITNLIMNAKQALQDWPTPRTITVESWHVGREEGVSEGQIFVAVTDNGPGVPKEIAHRIFEPFFTTKAAGSGTRL